MTEVGIPALLAADLRRLADRLYDMGYPVTQVEVAGGAFALMVDRGAGRAAILPSGLAALGDGELERTARALRGLAPSRPMTLLAWGAAPGPTGRTRLRATGVDLALYEPLLDDVLRFQVNRALAPFATAPRSALRA